MDEFEGFINVNEHKQSMTSRRLKSVHPYIQLDYDNDTSIITNPIDHAEVVCKTEVEEANALYRFGLQRCALEMSDDAFCEWAYFWLDRNDIPRYEAQQREDGR